MGVMGRGEWETGLEKYNNRFLEVGSLGIEGFSMSFKVPREFGI